MTPSVGRCSKCRPSFVQRKREADTTTLYHRTTAERAASVLAYGFRDATGHYLTTIELTGVFLSADPNLGDQEMPDGVVIVIELADSESDLKEYELVEEGKPYREWVVPASVIKSRGTVRRL